MTERKDHPFIPGFDELLYDHDSDIKWDQCDISTLSFKKLLKEGWVRRAVRLSSTREHPKLSGEGIITAFHGTHHSSVTPIIVDGFKTNQIFCSTDCGMAQKYAVYRLVGKTPSRKNPMTILELRIRGSAGKQNQQIFEFNHSPDIHRGQTCRHNPNIEVVAVWCKHG